MQVHQTAEGTGPRADIALHASELKARGFTVLDEHIIDAKVIDRARTLTQSRLSQLISQAKGAGCSVNQQYKFSEIVHRQRHRWDVRLGDARSKEGMHPIWAQVCSAALSAVTPIVCEAQGAAFTGIQAVQMGAVISRPGAKV